MTYLKTQQHKNLQAGVTLLLAILVLSALLAISFSIASIMFIEFRTSADLGRTEPTLYAASAISEEAIFNIKRNLPENLNFYDEKIGGKISVSTSSPITDSATITYVVPPKSTFSDTLAHFIFFDPADMTGGSGYGKVEVTYLNSGNNNSDKLAIYFCQYFTSINVDPTDPNSYSSLPCSDKNPGSTAKNYWATPAPSGYLLAPTEIWTLDKTSSPTPFDYNGKQELILVNQSTTKNIYVQIKTYDKNNQPLGLPFFGKKAVEINAQNGELNRHLRTLIPTAQIYGLTNTAKFLKTDDVTIGNWVGVYGKDGFNVISGTQKYPAYVAVSPLNNQTLNWSSIDPRALYSDTSKTTRVAAAWKSGSDWFIDFNFNDGLAHQVALYCVDYDSTNRAMTIEAIDGKTNILIPGSSYNLSNFHNGKYILWKLSGHIVLHFINTSGADAPVSGIFFE